MAGKSQTHGDAQRFRLMAYMTGFVQRNHYQPSIADMKRALGMERTAILWHLAKLRDEGRIDYLDTNVARSLQLKDSS